MKKYYSIFTVLALIISLNAIAGYGAKSNKYQLSQFSPNRSIAAVQATAGDKGMTEGGFFLHYNPYIPTKKYGWLKEATLTVNNTQWDQDEVDDYLDDLLGVGKYGFGHGLEFGNMFRLVDSEPIAIGLRLTWLDFGFAMFKPSSKYSSYDIKGFSIDVRAIKIGPYFTYAFTDQMAVDAFYQLTPTMNIGGLTGEYDGDQVGYLFWNYGLLHEMGLTYRFDMLSVGFGYGLGSLRTIPRPITVDGDIYELNGKSYASTFRMMLGMKF